MKPEKPIFHILNGDALLDFLPPQIEGERIVFRECLSDGPVSEESFSLFCKQRAEHISQYDGFDQNDYFDKTVPELEKIRQIPAGSEINLWFEDDLFCQINFWFVISSIIDKAVQTYLVRPLNKSRYGFASYTSNELLSLLEHRSIVNEMEFIVSLWRSYQKSEFQMINDRIPFLKEKFPFMVDAVSALIDSCEPPLGNKRISTSLQSIIDSMDEPTFTSVFKAFSEKESVFGFGDLQVKRMYDDLIRSNRSRLQ